MIAEPRRLPARAAWTLPMSWPDAPDIGGPVDQAGSRLPRDRVQSAPSRAAQVLLAAGGAGARFAWTPTGTSLGPGRPPAAPATERRAAARSGRPVPAGGVLRARRQPRDVEGLAHLRFVEHSAHRRAVSFRIWPPGGIADVRN